MKKKICVINGIEFDSPKYLEEYLAVGVCGLFLLITSPIWIWLYLLGILFKKMGKEKEVDVKEEEKYY